MAQIHVKNGESSLATNCELEMKMGSLKSLQDLILAFDIRPE